MLKRFTRRRWVRVAAGRLLAAYLKLVRRTTRFVLEPDEPYSYAPGLLPIIFTAWHGQHFLAPMMRRPDHEIAVLVSRSFDGEVNAAAAEALGLKVIRGSGGRNPQLWVAKGGANALQQMLATLEQGITVAQTADVPGDSPRRCGMGIVKLAQLSGRPVVAAASATSRSIRFNTRDRMRLPLPFCRGAFVVSTPVFVPADADKAALEAARVEVEATLNRVQERADELANGVRR
ncbi:MAG TPA: lysophospholipid acyltransferase family protein [Afifellaceae bacterium]|nr:lysophospholipid acyltransferase family protein [Afifellaceae bacterium]